MVCTYSRYIHYCPREDSRCLTLKELGGEAEGIRCSWRWVECSREQKSLDGLQEQHWAWWDEGSLGERWRWGTGRSPVLKQWRPKDGIGLAVAAVGNGDLSAWAVLGLSSAWNSALSVRCGPWILERECDLLSGTAAWGRQAGFQGMPWEGLLAWFWLFGGWSLRQ